MNEYTHIRTSRLPLALALASGVALGTALTACPPAPPSLPPCPTEDSVSCYWDGPTMGNGHGRSYTVDSDGRLTYTDCPRATAYDAHGVEVSVLGHTCQPGE